MVALVSMPFAVCAMPPIGLGLLKAGLTEAGIESRVYDFNLELLPLIDADLERASRLHDELAYLWDFMPGEWVFSPRSARDRDLRYLHKLIRGADVDPGLVAVLGRLRDGVDAFLEHCAAELRAGHHDIVGFTSSFMQTQPSIALARRLKAEDPRTTILFGGSNAFGPMGSAVLRCFPAVDVVARGEADHLIVDLVRVARGGSDRRLEDLPGICFRQDGEVVETPMHGESPDVARLPVPDYGDYFERLSRLEARHGRSRLPRFIPIETARGCWWGAKSHCTFCGLNADRMTFRSKPADAAIEMIRELRRRHGIDRFFAVDNIIDFRYFDNLLPRLAREPGDLHIHYEIKSNLTRSQVQRLHAAGIRKVQPGIESLSTPILRLMRKGVSAIQNVMALKWLTEYDIQTTWFILHGFPRETLEPYEEMAALLPSLMHLTAPRELAPVYLERFSPYHEHPEAHGIVQTGPAVWYRDAFPQVAERELGDLAYRFEFDEPDRDPRIDAFIESGLRPLVESWKERWARDGCTFAVVHGLGGMSAVVTGPIHAPRQVTVVDALVGRILRAADAITTRKRIAEHLGRPEEHGAFALEAEPFQRFLQLHRDVTVDQRALTPVNVDGVIDLLEERRLLMTEGPRVLSLPVDLTHRVAVALQPAGRRQVVGHA
jgi:ribosomal peptide maturation radical SAM protein 1